MQASSASRARSIKRRLLDSTPRQAATRDAAGCRAIQSVAMAEKPSGDQLMDRTMRALTVTLVASNTVGAVIVFVFLTLILPVRHPPPIGDGIALNAPVALVYVVASTLVASRWARAITFPRLAWLREDRAPSATDQRLVLRQPYV